MASFDVIEVLKESELFQDLDPENLTELAGICRTVSYAPGELVFQQGDFGESIYIIVEGHILLERTINLGSRKGRVAIEMLGKGRMLGCWYTLLGEKHMMISSAVCQKASTLLLISGLQLRRLITERSQLGLHVLERLCFILRDRMQAAYGAMDII